MPFVYLPEGVKAMKTQAWGWLTAAVLAAGLNASYHDGGLQWAHRIADQVGHSTNAVLALATGRADQFLTEARVLTARNESSSCRLNAALARAESRIARSDAEFDLMTAREQAQLARLEANRARMEAQVAHMRIPAVAFNPVVHVRFPEVRVPRVPVCPRVRVSIPRMPQITVPAAPVIHIDTSGAGPV